MRRCAELARGKYLVGCPDLIENMDVLSSLRGAQTLLFDLVERPEWVERKIWEINEVWFAAYQRIYDLIKLADGSSAFGAFYIWGPGKVAKVQCDASAMISPKMYRRFVVPALTAQCEWLDHSLYHLDGTQAMVHLDALLEIEAAGRHRVDAPGRHRDGRAPALARNVPPHPRRGQIGAGRQRRIERGAAAARRHRSEGRLHVDPIQGRARSRPGAETRRTVL